MNLCNNNTAKEAISYERGELEEGRNIDGAGGRNGKEEVIWLYFK